jgi:hypothetical protein
MEIPAGSDVGPGLAGTADALRVTDLPTPLVKKELV